MNNPFQYQNDLSALNNQFDDINSYIKSKKGAAKSDSILKKGQALAKQTADFASAGKNITSSVEELVGAAAAKKLTSGVIKPVSEALGRGVKNVASRITQAVRGDPPAAQNEGVEMEEKKAEAGEGEGDAAGEGGGDAAGEAAADGAGEVIGGGGADAAANAAAAAAQGGAGAGGGAAEGGDALIDGGADALIDGGADAAVSTLGGVAAADWWNPVGWVLGLAAAGVGIYSAVEAVDDNAAGKKVGAAAAGIKPAYSPPTSFAGRYVVPVNNALSAF